MKQVLLTLAVAGALLTFDVPGLPSGGAGGQPLGPSAAKADGGFFFYVDKGDHGPHYREKHRKHRKHHKRHDRSYRHHYDNGYDYGRHAWHGHRHHKKHRRFKRRHYVDSCHAVRKKGYWHGYYAVIGGTMCYDRRGRAYIVRGSRYLIRYL